MFSAKPTSPSSAVAKHRSAAGAMSWAIWSIARPSSLPLSESSSTVTGFEYVGLAGPGRSPLAMSCFAWIVSGSPSIVLVAVS